MDSFDFLTVANLLAISKRYVQLPVAVTRTRKKFVEALRALPEHVLSKIKQEATSAVTQGKVKNRPRRADDSRPRKRAKRSEIHPAPTHAWDEVPFETRVFNQVTESQVDAIVQSDFLRAPPTEVLKSRLTRYIDASGEAALEQRVCGSCARIRFRHQLLEVPISRLPNKTLLCPTTRHPAHVLHNGLLLHQPSIGNDGTTLLICMECFNSLKNNKRPQFSLGNNMWVGDVPLELQDLTLPERMLIARYFLAAFIVKLFPKQRGARAWDHAQMHNGLRGNVSTYRLDPKQVASIVDGRTYPPHPRILSATIGITFVGPKGCREPMMPNMFHVRRRKVKEALIWLKDNNPLYGDIEISETSLELLPVDGVPEQLMETAKYSTATDKLDREHAGYVPRDAAEDEECK